MPYSAEISRTNPTAILFLLDQSSSMLEPFGSQPEKRKADGVADALNRLLQNLVLKCAKADGIRDFFHVGMIRYGGRVESAFGGALAGADARPRQQDRQQPAAGRNADAQGGRRGRRPDRPELQISDLV